MRLLLALLIAATLTNGPAAVAEQPGPVWYWFSTCGGPMMTLEVRLDDRILHKSSFPLCRAKRGSPDSQGIAGNIGFTLRPDRALVWEGYREPHDKTPSNRPLAAVIWESSAEPDALVLGVTFMAEDRILMDTIHVARPGERDETSIAEGLVVRTYPPEPR